MKVAYKGIKISKENVTTKYKKEDVDVFQKELFIYLLGQQKRISFIPKLLHYDCDKLILRTENVGISLQEYCDEYGCELDDFIPKIRKMYNRLVKLGYYHNDLRLKNIIINPDTKQLFLIDFEFKDREYKDLDEENLVKKLKRKSRTKSK